MVLRIENEFIKVAASETGAELQSIVLKKNGREYLWQGDENYWPAKDYNLFPICARLIDKKYTYRGKTYTMDNHGFIRHTKLKGEKISENELLFVLNSNEETKAQYPFDFVYTVRYTIAGATLKTEYRVKNTGTDTMYFAVGGHPGFNVPLCENEDFDDYILEFDTVEPAKKYVFTPFFNTGRFEQFPLEDGKIIKMHRTMFNSGGIFFTDMSKGVTLKSGKSDAFVKVDYADFRNLGFWHTTGSPDAPFVCIEPWTSVPAFDGIIDDLETKEQMEKLSAGEEYTATFNITIG